ncbi:hypothetical protein [Mobiluncus curtisii]|jgi:hypothetical protein|uniref:Flagellin N-terminal domain-containing protein n=1 Tax=Mobiluncus curtisii ATCC 51333 TaxID=887326 RepID=E6LXF1_9ACTO|nr:hypothetical protein [Mobiluncus curtisii]EFU80705.1 hypothetical protein HMPREF0388_0424 [Mobiluncus curtisii ATCC 51333]
MQLNGLGNYQANALGTPWNNATTSKELATANHGPSGLSAGLNALRGASRTAPVAPTSTPAGGRHATVDGFGDEVRVSPTSSTRAEVSIENYKSQTAQAAVTTANVVNDSLGKTDQVLTGMKAIVSELSNQSLTRTRRAELTQAFGLLTKRLDSLVDHESFAGHKTLDGRFRATFTVGDSARVTIDATLPNGKSFNTEGLGLQGFADLLATSHRDATPAVVQSLNIAQGAVAQVRTGLSEATASTVNAMSASSKLLSAAIGGTPALAQGLVANTMSQLSQSGSAAFTAQANTAISSALRLLS